MEELGHNGSDDDDGGFAFLLEAFGEGFADGVEAHGRHGRKAIQSPMIGVEKFII